MNEDTGKMCNYKDMRENLVIKEGRLSGGTKRRREKKTHQS